MTTLIAIYLFIVGLACGSFYNVVGLRVPTKQSIVHPPSACTSCGTRLCSRDLVPLLSYMLARGKCRHCGAKVSIVYPIGELITGLLFASVYLYTGLSVELITGLLLVSLSVIVTVSDLKYMLIPNKILLAFTPILLIARLLHHEQPLWHYLLGAVVGGGVLLLIIIISRGGMGLGDAKLFALLGFVIGFPNILVALLTACLAGTIIGVTLQMLRIIKRKQPIPFGPFLVLGTIIAYFFGEAMINGYLSIIA